MLGWPSACRFRLFRAAEGAEFGISRYRCRGRVTRSVREVAKTAATARVDSHIRHFAVVIREDGGMDSQVQRGKAWVAAVALSLCLGWAVAGCSAAGTSTVGTTGAGGITGSANPSAAGSAAGTVGSGGAGGSAGSASAATAGAGASGSSAETSIPLARPGPTIDATAKGIATFGTPSGNIACVMTKGETAGFQSVRCDVLNQSWALPPKPADCQFDWSHGAYLEGGKAGLTCASDALIGADAPGLEGTWWADRPGAQRVSFSGRPDVVALAYGASMRLGTITCTSQTDGMHCTDAKTRGGFDVSRTAYRLR